MFKRYKTSLQAGKGYEDKVNAIFPSDSGFGGGSKKPTKEERPRSAYGRLPSSVGCYRPKPNPSRRFPFMDKDDSDKNEESEGSSSSEDEAPVAPSEPEPPRQKLAVKVNMMNLANQLQHHTADFADSIFAVRRGQAFSLKVEINRKRFKPQKDRLVLVFMIGKAPLASEGTLNRIQVENKEPASQDPFEWSAHVASFENIIPERRSEVVLSVRAAADCPVGQYKLKVILFRKRGKKMKERRVSCMEDKCHILFNPWCKDDQVYMASQEEKEEYVLNQTGSVYVGSWKKPSGRPWNFEPYGRATLETAVLLLQNSSVPAKSHGNATRVARLLSAMVNTQDDNGVLVGNWSGKYEGGVSPVAWTGSAAIFKKFLETGESVKYGQCWVFSALITSLGRCLGLPTRSVTNHSSAHDCNESLTIDKFFVKTPAGLMQHDENNDSVWNFHVWNESWFARPDLPEGYDGWQAYDATPQEASEGLMQCGPAPLVAIKEGDVHLGYDTGFIFSEVEGSRITWHLDPEEGTTEAVAIDNRSVGKLVSTKAVGSRQMHDLTPAYKYPTGSEEEKRILNKVYARSPYAYVRNLRKAEGLEKHDVGFGYASQVSDNSDIMVQIQMQNMSDETRTVEIAVDTRASYYTGVLGEKLALETMTVELKPQEQTIKNWSLKAKDYLEAIDEDAAINNSITGLVQETKQMFALEDSYDVVKPELSMTTSNAEPKVGEPFKVTVSFKNPVDLKLTKGEIVIEGPGIQKEMKIPVREAIPAYGEFSTDVELKAKYPGKREVLGLFNSRQLIGISGSVQVHVQK